MDKEEYLIFNPEGGLGKVIASTAVTRNIKATYPERKIIVVTPWPEVYLNNPDVYRVFRSGVIPYFYKDYIEGRETIVLKGEPYYNTGHIYNNQVLAESWCKTHNIEWDGINTPLLSYTPAEVERISNQFTRSKPTLLLQTNGGMFHDNETGYCWTRDIPTEQAQILVDNLKEQYHILHATRPNCPTLHGVEALPEMDKRTLMLLPAIVQQRILIDSCLQHAAAAFDVESSVLWVGTHPEVFGYEVHKNFKPAIEPIKEQNTAGIDSFLFDYDFSGPAHEFPYPQPDIFNLQDIFDSVVGVAFNEAAAIPS
jgi:hypothetical protein